MSQPQPSTSPASSESARMTREEVRASASLAAIFALRMLGLFLVLPVFAVFAHGLPGGDDATLVGIAMGVYGLVQAFGQIPFGMASDRFGRKPVIIIGLLLFAAGSFVCAGAHSLAWIIVGRALQGAGAISAAITAFIADSTREEHRTKAMAMVGASIGLTFAISLVASPVLYRWIGMSGMFSLIGLLSLLAVVSVAWLVPAAPMLRARRVPLGEVLRHGELMRLNLGVFTLHMTQLAMFLVLPGVLVQAAGMPVDEHWKIYLPVVFGSFVLMLPPVFVAEKHGRMKQVFIGAIALMLVSQLGFWAALSHPVTHWWVLVVLLFVFFVAFNILEASQPSLVSRIAPAASKGTALGVYNTLQALGLFCGGALGGWIKQHVDGAAVFLLCAGVTFTWLIIAANMKNLPRRGTHAAGATA